MGKKVSAFVLCFSSRFAYSEAAKVWPILNTNLELRFCSAFYLYNYIYTIYIILYNICIYAPLNLRTILSIV